jgi:hypothetical protein
MPLFKTQVFSNRAHKTDELHRLHADSGDTRQQIDRLFLGIDKVIGIELLGR